MPLLNRQIVERFPSTVGTALQPLGKAEHGVNFNPQLPKPRGLGFLRPRGSNILSMWALVSILFATSLKINSIYFALGRDKTPCPRRSERTDVLSLPWIKEPFSVRFRSVFYSTLAKPRPSLFLRFASPYISCMRSGNKSSGFRESWGGAGGCTGIRAKAT